MNPLKWARNLILSKLVPGAMRERMAASYDMVQTTRHNEKHWVAADALSPNAAQTQGVRRIMRMRSRYEAANNPLVSGVLRTMADHTIGTGPKLQILSLDPLRNNQIEGLWEEWSAAAGIPQKLWLMKETEVRDGECFLLQIGNPALRSRVQLDYQLLEADYVTSLRPQWTPWQVDGITYDPQWNPISYQVVTQRPNDVLPIVWPQQHTVDAKYVIHYFRQDRPGQGRGVPALASAFELLAVLRRYIAATVSAAEVAASFAAFIKSTGPAVPSTNGQSADDWLTLEIQRNLITMLPEGYDVAQLKPEQPTQSFTEFVKTLLTLLTRCLSMPLNIALCDSSGYNFSSSRLDHQTYFRAIEIDRTWIEHRVLERIFDDFCREVELVLGLPAETLRGIKHEWHWDPPISVDPEKEANARLMAVTSGQKSITDMQKESNAGGDIVKENAAYFGVPEEAMRKAMFEKLWGANAQPVAPLPALPDQPKATPAHKPAPPPRAKARGRTTIAAAANLDLQFAASSAALHIEAADEADPNAVQKFGMVGYTGGAMRIEDHEHPVVIDLESVIVASEGTPILFAHDDERPVGHAERVVVSPKGIIVPPGQGFFSASNEWRDQVVNSARRKYPWQSSVGGRAERIEFIAEGQDTEVNGRVFTGPVEVAYGFRLREISILTIGADANTSVDLAAKAAQPQGNRIMGFEEWVKSLGFDPATLSEQQRNALQNEWQSKQTAAQADEGDGDDEHMDAEGDDDQDKAGEDDQDDTAEGDDDEERKETAASGRRSANLRANGNRARDTRRGTSARTADVRANGRKDDMKQYRRDLRAAEAKELRRSANIRKLCGDNSELAAKAIEAGWSSERVELELLRAARPKGVMAGPLGIVARGGENGPDQSAVIECSMLVQSGVKLERLEKLDNRYSEDVLNAAAERRNRNYSITRLVHESLLARGVSVHGGRLDDETMRAALHYADLDMKARYNGGNIYAANEGFSTVSLPGILSNLLNKSLLVSFIEVPTASQEFCGSQDLNDFKPATRYRLSAAGTIEKVGAEGELKSLKLGEETWSNQLDTYGKLAVLNRQMWINDDLDAFTSIPKLLGRLCALSVEESVFTKLLANETQSDGNAFFHTAHNNLKTGAGSALSISALTDAVTLFLKQTDAQGKPIVLNPDTLLVPSELKVTADQLYKDTNVISILGAASGSGKVTPQSNPHANKYRPVSSPYLSNGTITNNSSTRWFLLANPADVPLISIGYLKGQKTPTVDQGQTSMEILGFIWRIYFDYGVGNVDWRAGVQNDGT